MHLQHEDNILLGNQTHVLEIHTVADSYSFFISNEFSDSLPHGEIDLGSDGLIKNLSSLDFIALLFLLAGLIITAPMLLCASKRYIQKSRPVSLYYLFQPPLRAPPQ